MQGKSWLITAGPTCEDIDPMRFLSNRSSGRMGYEIASVARSLGYEVTLISGPTNLPTPKDVKVVNIRTAEEMYLAVKEHYKKCDVALMAAAVADYTPLEISKTKIKKSAGNLMLELKRTKDILAFMGESKQHQTLVGFALETADSGKSGITPDMRTRAETKLRAKNVDFAVLNAAAAAGADFSSISVFDVNNGKWRDFDSAPKQEQAKNIISFVAASG